MTTTTAPAVDPAQVRAPAAAAMQSLTAWIEDLAGQMAQVQAAMDALWQHVQSAPNLAAGASSMAAVYQAEYNDPAAKYSTASQQANIAQVCADNTGTPTDQCISLYG